MSKQARIIAHRGVAQHYPENTLAALLAAEQAGADAVELDVQFSSDGVPMVLHDALLERTTDRHGDVGEHTAEQLAGIGAHEPQRFGDRFLGEFIPSLSHCCTELAGTTSLQVFIEIKPESLTRHPVHLGIPAVLEASAALGTRRVIISYNDGALQTTRSLAGCAIGWVLPAFDRATIERARALQPDYLFCDRLRLPAEPTALPDGPWAWAAYEVENGEQGQALLRQGVHWLETMAPQELRAELAP